MPAGSTACISLGETVSETGAPVAAQCDETRAVRPISAGNIKVSSAHRIQTAVVNFKDIRSLAQGEAVADDVPIFVIFGTGGLFEYGGHSLSGPVENPGKCRS